MSSEPQTQFPACVNCGDPLAGPGAVASGPDTAWHAHCRACFELCAGQLDLVLDRPGGARVQIYRCRRCGTARSCRPGTHTRCHVCLDERSTGPVVARAARNILGPARATLMLVRQGMTEPPVSQFCGAVEEDSGRTLRDVLRLATRPGWVILAADVHGLPWSGMRTQELSHGTWGRHLACGNVARLGPGPAECPACGPGPEPGSSLTHTSERYPG